MLHLVEKREGPEHPYGVVDRSYATSEKAQKAKFAENLFHALG